MRRLSLARRAVALAAIALAAVSLWFLESPEAGLSVERVSIDGTPATVRAPEGAGRAPAVIVSHGFSGSRRLMRAFSVTLARNGYVAVSYDSLGHGANPRPLAGDVTREDGATLRLVEELERVIAFARDLPASDGRVALLGHSMAADIVARAAIDDPEVAATVAVSMFSPVVTAAEPPNLLIVVGEWEPPLVDEALRVLRLAAGPDAEPGRTYGAFADGSARRVAIADAVEHIGVLYSAETLRESTAWLDAAFERDGSGYVDARGPWILALIVALVALFWPVSAFAPRAAEARAGAGLGWRRLAPVALIPAALTPLMLAPFDISFLPIVVGDYLALHFALYGALTALALRVFARDRLSGLAPDAPRALAAAAALTAAWALLGIGGLVETQITSFLPTPARLPLLLALLPGATLYFLADEWATRGEGAARGGYAATKALFLLSLAAATALNLERLFFLIILAPALIAFFIVFGLFSGWIYRASRHPFAAGLANGLVFATAIAVTFPMLAG